MATTRPPYPTARDLYAELDRVTPDSLKYTLKDLFEDMTFYENKADSATAKKQADEYQGEVTKVQTRVQWTLTLFPAALFALFGLIRWRLRESARANIRVD